MNPFTINIQSIISPISYLNRIVHRTPSVRLFFQMPRLCEEQNGCRLCRFCQFVQFKYELNQMECQSILFLFKVSQSMDMIKPFSAGEVIADHFRVLNIRGQGTFGVVYQCLDIQNGGRVAVKQSHLQLQIEGIPATAIRQITILKELQHENIVKLKDVIFAVPNLFLVFELLEMDLRDYIDSQTQLPLPPVLIKSLIQQLLKAINLCHSRRIIHRDIKPGNVLLNPQGSIKLADFGLARPFTYPIKQLSEQVVTLWYRAPEVLIGCHDYGPPIDVWSIGCIFAQLAFGALLFNAKNDLDQLDQIISTLGSPTPQTWPEYFMNMEMQEEKVHSNGQFQSKLQKSQLNVYGQDLLRRMMTLNPKARITASEALKHPYFNS